MTRPASDPWYRDPWVVVMVLIGAAVAIPITLLTIFMAWQTLFEAVS